MKGTAVSQFAVCKTLTKGVAAPQRDRRSRFTMSRSSSDELPGESWGARELLDARGARPTFQGSSSRPLSAGVRRCGGVE